MIVSASYRTDIPAFYGNWFVNRLQAGYCKTRNPYGGSPGRIELSPTAVDGIVFWTRNLEPFASGLLAVERLGIPFVVQYTITGLPRVLERSVIDSTRAVAQMQKLRERYGPRVTVWRYDPIVITDCTSPEWHKANFARLAAALKGVTDEVTVSIMKPYRKTIRNLDSAARSAGFVWRDPSVEEKRALLASLTAIAADHGMKLTLCTQPELSNIAGTYPAACIDAERLCDIADKSILIKQKGNRPGCFCAESRDIGAYDSCPHGCVYCYAVNSRDAAHHAFTEHNQNSEFLTNR
ncbi:MAG: DUF1848 domain-containing protein [Rhodospirillaceae bacterium]